MLNTNCQKCQNHEAKMSCSLIGLDFVCATCFIEAIDSLSKYNVVDIQLVDRFQEGFVPAGLNAAAINVKVQALCDVNCGTM